MHEHEGPLCKTAAHWKKRKNVQAEKIELGRIWCAAHTGPRGEDGPAQFGGGGGWKRHWAYALQTMDDKSIGKERASGQAGTLPCSR